MSRRVNVERCGGCGQWLQRGTACGVCVVDPCANCDHPVEWHGRHGCRGWSMEASTKPTGVDVDDLDLRRCLCRLDDIEATVTAVQEVPC